MNEYSYLTLDELRRLILTSPPNVRSLYNWFERTQHVTAQQAKEAARASA